MEEIKFTESYVSKGEQIIFVIIGIVLSILLFLIPYITIYTIFFDRSEYKNRKNLYRRLKYGKPLQLNYIISNVIYFNVDGYDLISWNDNKISLHSNGCIICSFQFPSLYDALIMSKILEIVNKRIKDLKLERCDYYTKDGETLKTLNEKIKDLKLKTSTFYEEDDNDI